MTVSNGLKEIRSDRLLLVEGSDEDNIVAEMLGHSGVGGIQVIDVGGKYSFRSNLEVLLSEVRSQRLHLSAIGVLRDADDSAEGALRSVADALHSAGLPVPSSHGAFAQGRPSTGIFILPDGESPGSIESLCWASVEDTSAARCSKSYLHCLRESAALDSRNAAKTLIHAFLAAQREPYARAGEGALKGYWPFDHPAFAPLEEFVRRLAVI